MCLCDKLLVVYPLILTVIINTVDIQCAPPSINNTTTGKFSPKLKNYDIWGQSSTEQYRTTMITDNDIIVVQEKNNNVTGKRNGKVLNFFPVPVDDECLSDDGRRSGVCLNVYECRIQGGTSRGQCALGFGVCCIFTATCDQEVFNNITYIVSPNFPALMSNDIQNCKIKIKMISSDISQLRLDFVHFSMGQPNRRTGICDGDVFEMTGGSTGNFSLCGQNHGQHIYYDVPNSNSREEPANPLEMIINFSNRFTTSRLWEIRVYQIPFSQRAPAGCLQYFTGIEGIIKTFNFVENGRHLANQNYRACIRQETNMCSIAYEPCHDQAFRINGIPQNNGLNGVPIGGGGGGGGGAGAGGGGGGIVPQMAVGTGTLADGASPLNDPLQTAASDQNPVVDNATGDGAENVAADDAATGAETADADPPADNPEAVDDAQETAADDDAVADDDPDADVEGSGGGDTDGGLFSSFTSLFARKFHGSSRRQSRQYYSTCTDRITTPCVVEDFIAAGMGNVPDCTPIHCGNSLCSNGLETACRIESTVTPFGIGVHFGDGIGIDKGSPEDNIGACLKFNQLNCA